MFSQFDVHHCWSKLVLSLWRLFVETTIWKTDTAAFQMTSQRSGIFRFCCSSIVSAAALCELIAKLSAGMVVGSTLRNIQRQTERWVKRWTSVRDKIGISTIEGEMEHEKVSQGTRRRNQTETENARRARREERTKGNCKYTLTTRKTKSERTLKRRTISRLDSSLGWEA